MGRHKRCNHSSSSSEPVEQNAEISKWLSKGSHETSPAKCFLGDQILKGQPRQKTFGPSYVIRL